MRPNFLLVKKKIYKRTKCLFACGDEQNDRLQPSFKKSFQDCCKSFFIYDQRSLIKRKSKTCTVQVWQHLHICLSAISYIIGVMELSLCFNCLLLHNCVRCLWFAQHKRKTSTRLAINPRFLKTTPLYWRGSNLGLFPNASRLPPWKVYTVSALVD